MAAQQRFYGSFEFRSREQLDRLIQQLGDDGPDGAVRVELERARVGASILWLERDSHQPHVLFDAWSAALSALAEEAQRGHVVAALRHEHGVDVTVHRASSEVGPQPEPSGAANEWLHLQPDDVWRFAVEGSEETTEWRITDEGRGRVSIREDPSDTFNATLDTNELIEVGSALDVVITGEVCRWIDTDGEVGDAWLSWSRHHESLSMQRRLEDVEVEEGPGVIEPARRYAIHPMFVPHDSSSWETWDRPPACEIVVLTTRRRVGPVRIETERRSLVRATSTVAAQPVTKRPWWKLWG